MKRISLILVLSSMTLTEQAIAGEAHVCRSASIPFNAANAAITDSTIFTCGGGVTGTIPQLAQQGWTIVQRTDQTDMSNPSNTPSIYTQLIIQKE